MAAKCFSPNAAESSIRTTVINGKNGKNGVDLAFHEYERSIFRLDDRCVGKQ